MFTHETCGQKHPTVEIARRCETGQTYPCMWLVEIDSEDGPEAVECGAPAWDTPDGYTCQAGHSHVNAETRHRQGWDYAHDPQEAGRLARQGVHPVAMDGGATEIHFR